MKRLLPVWIRRRSCLQESETVYIFTKKAPAELALCRGRNLYNHIIGQVYSFYTIKVKICPERDEIMDKKDKNTVFDRFRGRSSPFQNRSKPFQKRSKAFQDRSAERSNSRSSSFQNRSWNEKAQRTAQNNRHVPTKIGVNLVFMAFCFVGTLAELPWKFQAGSYLGWVAVFLVTDPLDMLGRFLAPQSQKLLALMAMLAIMVLIQPVQPFVGIVGIIASGSVTAIWLCNQTWLASYNWLMSAAVQEALLIDVDNKATQAWQTHGRRETRTLLHELGYQATDDILDILHRPVYIAGYLNGYKKTAKYNKRLENALKAAEQGQEYKRQCALLQKEVQSMESDLKEAEQMLQEEIATSAHWQELYQSMIKENEQLRTINAELVADLPDPEAMAEHTIQIRQQEDDAVKDTVLAALAKGMSYADAGKLAGVSKTTAYRIKKEADQEADQQNNIITIGKVAGGE